MQISVVPASTRVGQAIVQALLDSPTTPTVHAVFRDIAKVPSKFNDRPNFKAVQGTVDDASSLDFTGSDAVIALTPPTYDDTPIVEHARTVSENTKTAIKAAGSVKRLVLVSSVGAQFDHDVGQIKTNNMAEQILGDAAPEVVFVRCSYFMSNWEMAKQTLALDPPFFFSTVTPLDYKVAMIDAKDIGRVCAEEGTSVGSPLPAVPHIYELHGPEEYSADDVHKTLEQILGKKIEVKPVEKEALPDFFGQVFPPSTVPEWVELSTCFLPGGILTKHPTPEKDIKRGKVGLKEAFEDMFNDM